MSHPQGCSIVYLNQKICLAVLHWIAGGAKPNGICEKLIWLLAHCSDGVTWGRFDDIWRLSSSPFPDCCTKISPENILEIRLFGPREEILIWRSNGALQGRCLTDVQFPDKNSPTRPYDEVRILLGDRLEAGPKDGFTVVGAAGGRRQVVPLECAPSDFRQKRSPLRLKVRHYFEQDDETGVVRLAVSRLVDVFKEVV